MRFRSGLSERRGTRRTVVAAAWLCWLAAMPSSRSQSLPPPIDAMRPDPSPVLPADFDTFSPPLGSVPAVDGTPAIAEWTRSGAAGDTLVFAGSGFSPGSRFRVFAQTDATDASTTDVEAAAVSDAGAALTLPRSSASGMYCIWPLSAAGPGTPVLVNRAEGWWLNPVRASPGDTVSLYGRNLSRQHGKEKSWILLQQAGKPGVWAQVSDVNPYKVDFILPRDLAMGAWEVWVHNGHGGDLGWHSPHRERQGPFSATQLVVEPPVTYDGGVVNVKDHGATGDGVADDTVGLLAALKAAAGVRRPVLYFPRGTYQIGAELGPLQGADGTGIQLRGDGPDATIIQGLADRGPRTLVRLQSNDVEIRGVTLRLNSLVHEKRPKAKRSVLAVGEGKSFSGLKLIDSVFDGERSLGFELSRYRDVLIKGCTVIAQENQMGTLGNVRVDGCSFKGRADAGMALYWLGGQNVSVTNCTATDYDSSAENAWDQFQGRFVTCSAYGQRVDNWYLGHNQTIDLTVRPEYFNQNTGEQFMWEFMDIEDVSQVASATADTVVFEKAVRGRIAWYANAVVVSGKGIGQSRAIHKYDPDTRTAQLGAPWRVVPDGTSIVALSLNMQRTVVYDNDLDGKERAHRSEKHIASTGVEPFGGSHTLVVDGNRMTSLRAGIATFGTQNKAKTASSITFFNVYQNNRIDTVRKGVWHRAGPGPKDAAGLTTLGTITRRNVIVKATEDGVRFESRDRDGRPGADLNVIENNRIEADAEAIVVVPEGPGAPAHTIIRKESP